MNTRFWLAGTIGLTLAATSSVATPAAAAEKRCGWIINPTPGNWSLRDRDDEWTLAEQGGFEAPGFEELPDMSTRGRIRTNGNYGISCGCLTLNVDHRLHTITRILSGQPRPLAQCRADRRLPRP